MPQVYQTTQIARPTYWDRNPTARAQSTSNVYSPSGTLTLLSYSPPAGKAAYVESVYLGIERGSAPAASGDVQCSASVAMASGGSGLILRATFNTGSSGAVSIAQNSDIGFIAFGDTISITLFDGSTGGTVTAQVCIKLTEFVYG